ncbi:6,7-dimethyl-8-ribityllumazine synthase [bacterium]|nr:6,7-dimethyl-8-ribityllumazine synthase [bacterium]
MAEWMGKLTPPAGRFALVASQFNGFIVDRLIDGARGGLSAHGVADENIDIVRVPGALELPLVADRLACSGSYVAVICLGTIIKGDTDHYDVVVHQSARGIADAAIRSGIPVMNAVLTTHTLEQAIHRAGAKSGNKGYEVAGAAIEMVNLLSQLPGKKS